LHECEHFLGAFRIGCHRRICAYDQSDAARSAQQLGTEIPVYVVLTKLDRIPGYTEFVRNLTNEEVSQALGIATTRSETSSGLYAEQATNEVTKSLDQLIFSLGNCVRSFHAESISNEFPEREDELIK